MKIVLVSGGFDPLHTGHIEYFKAAKKLGNKLAVGVNSNDWLTKKKGQPFMDISERLAIIENLSMVDYTFPIDDSDGTAKNAIIYLLDNYPNEEIIFANGGDRTSENIPEMDLKSDRLSFVFGVGGENKLNSSSKILTEWKTPKTYRQWGYYRILHSDGPSTKVKELVVEPSKSLSLQRHKLRNEYWIVTDGIATINHGMDVDNLNSSVLEKHDEINIVMHEWHQLINNTDKEIKIVEIQYGINCIEEDIERV